MEKINVGNTVRSYDFPGISDDSFVEGVVEEVGVEFEGCSRYKINVNTRVWGGEEKAIYNEYVYPPVNGTPDIWGGICNGVIRVDN